MPVWRGICLCVVFQRHRETFACRGFIAGPVKPCFGICVGLAVFGTGHGREIVGGLCVGVGIDIRRAAGDHKKGRLMKFGQPFSSFYQK